MCGGEDAGHHRVLEGLGIAATACSHSMLRGPTQASAVTAHVGARSKSNMPVGNIDWEGMLKLKVIYALSCWPLQLWSGLVMLTAAAAEAIQHALE